MHQLASAYRKVFSSFFFLLIQVFVEKFVQITVRETKIKIKESRNKYNRKYDKIKKIKIQKYLMDVYNS